MTRNVCKSVGCHRVSDPHSDFCPTCLQERLSDSIEKTVTAVPQSLSDKYPKYYKPVGDLVDLDVYAVHHLFNIQDPSGCIQHASKKLLLSGVRTGGKSTYHDIEEARDTLTRWLQLNTSE